MLHIKRTQGHFTFAKHNTEIVNDLLIEKYTL